MHGKAGRARCASTRSTLRLFHTYAQRPQREIPHLRKCPYKEGVGTTQNQMLLHVVGCSLPPFGRLMGSWYHTCTYHPIHIVCRNCYVYMYIVCYVLHNDIYFVTYFQYSIFLLHILFTSHENLGFKGSQGNEPESPLFYFQVGFEPTTSCFQGSRSTN